MAGNHLAKLGPEALLLYIQPVRFLALILTGIWTDGLFWASPPVRSLCFDQR